VSLPFFRNRLAIIGAVVAGLLFATHIFLQELYFVRSSEIERYRSRATQITDAVTRSAEITKARLQAVVALFESSATVSEREFARFVDAARIFDQGPHLRAIAVMPMLRSGQLDLLNDRIRDSAARRSAFGYPEWTPIAADLRDLYAPVVLAASPTGVSNIVGYDLATNATRLQTALDARDTGEILMTAPVVLSQDRRGDHQSVLLLAYTPNGRVGYRESAGPENGYPALVAIGYTPGKHLEELFAAFNDLDFFITVTDTTDPRQPVPLFLDASPPSAELIYQSNIAFSGRVWAIQFDKTVPSIFAIAPTLTYGSYALGCLMILFLGYVARQIVANEASLENRVAARTAELEEAQDQLNLALVDAERANQAKTEFLATMSHEFRTPLNAILGFSDVIHQQVFGPIGPDRYKQYAADIHKSGQHMLQLVNDILDLSAIEAGALEMRFTPLDVSQAMEDVVSVCREIALTKGIGVTFQQTGSLPVILADERAVRQVLMNLVSNAVKYSAQGSKIEISAFPAGNAVEIQVKDSGDGIPAEKVDRILKPFVRGESNPHISHDGAGLGLSIVNVLVAKHGGELRIESEVGEGTLVTVSFPVVSEIENTVSEDMSPTGDGRAV